MKKILAKGGIGMEYRFAEDGDFSDFSSGNVLKHFSGMPCFPVRLNLELFDRAKDRIGRDGLTVYDPCCGSGFSLTVLGLARQAQISALYASDVEDRCVEAARCNASLVSREGLAASRDRLLEKGTLSEERRRELNASTARLASLCTSTPPETRVFRHDILSGPPALPRPADYIFADLPYGILADWKSDGKAPCDIIAAFFASVMPVLAPDGILCVCGRKDLRLPEGPWRRIEKIRAGKRLVYLAAHDG